ncbi:MAG TPA: succinylglutamate desuccinylase/aspartoacylase family protein [bacterium]|jgi:hypothetical protein
MTNAETKDGRTAVRPYTGIVLLLVVLSVCAMASRDFLKAWRDEPLYPSKGMTAHKHLSDYFAGIKGTRADGDVYIFEGKESGGTTVVLGGTHPNEVAGVLAADVLLENATVTRGRLIVLPRANHSAFTQTEPGEGHPASFEIATAGGPRRFRMGCRFTNPLDQWPDPEVYLHHPSGQELSGNETRNLNRAFPGRSDGNFTERAAFAITSLVNAEKADLVIDLHEASPEYPVINAIVAHEKAMDLAATANLTLQGEGLSFNLEPSPQNFHGLTHRELGDATPALAVLMESANIMQGRLRSRTSAEKILSGKDDCYLSAARANLLRVPYDSTGIPVGVRVGRHLAGVRALMDGLAFVKPDKAMEVSDIPTYDEVQTRGLGAFLAPRSR